MRFFSSKPSSKTYFELGFLVFLFLVSIVLVSIGYRNLNYFLTEKKEQLISEWESKTGYTIEYNQFQPGLINGLKFSDIYIQKIEEPQNKIQIDTLKFEYAFLDWLSVKKKYRFRRIFVDGVTVSLKNDYRHSSASFEKELATLWNDNWSSLFKWETDELIVRQVKISYANRRSILSLEDFNFIASIDSKKVEFAFETSVAVLAGDVEKWKTYISLTGENDLEKEEILFDISSDSAKFGRRSLPSLQSSGIVRKNEILLGRNRQFHPDDTWFVLNMQEDNNIDLEINFKKTKNEFLDQLLPPSPENASYQFATLFSANFDSDIDEWTYKGDIRLNNAEKDVHAGSGLTVVFHGDEKKLWLDKSSVTYLGVSSSFAGSIDLETMFPQGALFVNAKAGDYFVQDLAFVLDFVSDEKNLSISNREIVRLADKVEMSFNALAAYENQKWGGNYALVLYDSDLSEIFQKFSGQFNAKKENNSTEWDVSYMLNFQAFTLSKINPLVSKILGNKNNNLNLSSAGSGEGNTKGWKFTLDKLVWQEGTWKEHRFWIGAEFDSEGKASTTLDLDWDSYVMDLLFTMDKGQLEGNFSLNNRHARYWGNNNESTLDLQLEHDWVALSFNKKDKTIDLDVNKLPLWIEGYWIRLSSDIQGGLKKDDSLTIKQLELALENVYPLNPILNVVGNLDKEGLTLNYIQYEDSLSSLNGKGIWQRENQDLSIQLLGEERLGLTQEVYSLKGKLAENLDLDLVWQGARFDRFFVKDFEGDLSGNIKIKGPGNAVSIVAQMHTNEGTQFQEKYLAFNTEFHWKNSMLGIDKLEIDYDSFRLENRYFTFRNLEESLAFSFDVYSQNDLSKISLNFTGLLKSIPLSELQPVSTKGWLSRNWKGVINSSPLYWNSQEYMPGIRYLMSKKENSFLFQDEKQEHVSLAYKGDEKTFDLALTSSYFPLYLIGSSTWRDDWLSINLERIIADASLLNFALLNNDPIHLTPFVVFEQGLVSGYLKLEGSPDNLVMDGRLQIYDLGVKTPYVDVDYPVSLVSTPVYIENNVVRIPPIHFNIGDSSVDSDATFYFTNNHLDEYKINVTLSGEYGVPIGYDIGGFQASGFVQGKVVIGGKANQHYLLGEGLTPSSRGLRVNHLLLMSSNTSRSSMKSVNSILGRMKDHEQKRALFTVNLPIEIGEHAQLYYPNNLFWLVSLGIQENDVLQLNYNNEKQDKVSIRGDVNIASGEINYLQRKFSVNSGTLLFKEGQDPYVDLFASLDLEDNRSDLVYGNNPIVISMRAQSYIDKNLQENFRPIFSSQPSRSQQEILSFLQDSFTPDNIGSELVYNATGIVGDRSDVAVDSLLIQPLATSLKETLNVDILRMKTSFVGNAINGFVDNFLIDTTAPVTQGNSFQSYLDNSSIEIGKNINKRLSLGIKGQFTYEEDNLISAQSERLEQDYTLFVNLDIYQIDIQMGIEYSYQDKEVNLFNQPTSVLRIGFDYRL